MNLRNEYETKDEAIMKMLQYRSICGAPNVDLEDLRKRYVATRDAALKLGATEDDLKIFGLSKNINSRTIRRAEKIDKLMIEELTRK